MHVRLCSKRYEAEPAGAEQMASFDATFSIAALNFPGVVENSRQLELRQSAFGAFERLSGIFGLLQMFHGLWDG